MTRYVEAHGRLIEVEGLDTGAEPSKARRYEAEAFVKVPLKWLATASKVRLSRKAIIVGIVLHYLAWRTKGSAFACPNAIFERHGVNRKTKRLALDELETAGAIAIERRGRRAPRVTLLDLAGSKGP